MIDDFLLNLLASFAYDLLKSLPSRFQGSRDDLLRDLRAEMARRTQALEALNDVLARLGSERVVRIEGSASNSIIIPGDVNLGSERKVQIDGSVFNSPTVAGDGNTVINMVIVKDGGNLARQWETLRLDDAQARERYYQEIAAIYEKLTFPLYGLDFSTALEEVYLYPSFHRLRHGLRISTTWREGDPVPSVDELLQNPRPVAVLGMLGDGKTTTLQYLTWLYARRPSDRLHWRLGELVPFLLTASDLAEHWQDETDLVTACSRAASQFYHHPLLNPYLVERVLRTALEQGVALILVDALDEYQPAKAQERQKKFVIALSQRWQSDPLRQNSLLLSSRPYAFLQTDFLPYALQEIGETGAEVLAYHLGKVLLRQQETDAERIDQMLEDLMRLVTAPKMRSFLTPFYVTLLTVSICREPDFATGLARAGDIKQWAGLYRFFLRQTFRWEQDKSGSAVEEKATLLALAHVAWQTFAPKTPELSLDLPLPFSERDREEALTFWKRTGLIWRNEFTGTWTFAHAGFQTFGVALWLKEAVQRGRLAEVERLQTATMALEEWDMIWTLYYGL